MLLKALGLWIGASLLASTGKIVNFDTYAPGKTPPGWTVAMTDRGGEPRWEILKDQSAPTQPFVLGQVSRDPARMRLPLAIFQEVSLRDGDVSVRMKPVAGRLDPGGGLVWRYRDENNYYLVRADALANSVSVFKVQDGRRTPLLAGARHQIPMNGWTILKVSARGPRFQVYLDHRRILEGFDHTFTGPGKTGVSTMSDSVTYFDDFRVYPK
jgi:hypothetical protein